jgi:hypothetical protein
MFGSMGVLHALLGVPRHDTAVLGGTTSCRNVAPLTPSLPPFRASSAGRSAPRAELGPSLCKRFAGG